MRGTLPGSVARSELLQERVLVLAAELVPALAVAVAALQQSKQLATKLHLVYNSRHVDMDELQHSKLAKGCAANPAQSRHVAAWLAANRSC